MSAPKADFCACCERAVNMNFLFIDRDFQGKVCRECVPWLLWAEKALQRSGLIHPSLETPEQVT